MFVAIDVGGTSTRLAQSTSLENPTLINRVEFPTSSSFETDFSQIIKYLNKIKETIKGIGIGIAGKVDKNNIILTHSNNLPHYINQPYVKVLQNKTRTKVIMANDGIASTLAEAFYTENHRKNFIYITWGTGIAAFSLSYVNGKPVSAKLDRPTYYPMWEEEFSGNGIYKKYGKKAEYLDTGLWIEIFQLFEYELRKFIQKTNPDLIVFGGGVVDKQWNDLKSLLYKIKDDTGVKSELTTLGKDIGLYGGFALLRNNKF